MILSGKALFTEKNSTLQVLKGMLLVQLAINFVTFLFYEPPHSSRYDYSRYLVPSSVWVVPLLCCMAEEKKTLLRHWLYAVICAVFIGNGMLNAAFFRDPDRFTQDYDGLAYHTTDTVEIYSGAADFLQKNGYDLGYAVYDANVLIEKMNGLPVVWLDKTVDGGLIYRDLLTRRSYREISGKKPFFIGFQNEAASFRALPCSEGSEPVFSDDNVYIYELKDQAAFKEYLDLHSN